MSGGLCLQGIRGPLPWPVLYVTRIQALEEAAAVTTAEAAMRRDPRAGALRVAANYDAGYEIESTKLARRPVPLPLRISFLD